MRFTRLSILALLSALLVGCSGMKPKDFEGTTPALDLFEYFAGPTRAWGIFQDRSGTLKRQFTVDIMGEIEGDLLTLTEDFVYADGEESQRIWRITRIDEHCYEGRADDVVGVAEGIVYGQALNWTYTLQLPYKGSTIDVKLNDWMFLQPDGILVNRATVSKFGLKVGEVTIFFQRPQGG
jgi:hypothetical protein